MFEIRLKKPPELYSQLVEEFTEQAVLSDCGTKIVVDELEACLRFTCISDFFIGRQWTFPRLEKVDGVPVYDRTGGHNKQHVIKEMAKDAAMRRLHNSSLLEVQQAVTSNNLISFNP